MRTGETLQGGKKANKWQLAHGRSVPLLHKVLLHSASSLLLIWCRGNPRRALSFFFVFPTLPSLRPGAIFPGKRGGEKELQQAGTVEQFAELGEGSSRVKANKNMAYYVHGRYEIEPYGEETQISPTVEKPNCLVHVHSCIPCALTSPFCSRGGGRRRRGGHPGGHLQLHLRQAGQLARQGEACARNADRFN